MKLIEAFPPLDYPHITALVGGGGKTTLMYTLARCYRAAGIATTVTTTTKISNALPDWITYAPNRVAFEEVLGSGGIPCIGTPYCDTKLSEPAPELFARACELSRVLVEADGAKRMPLKAPAAHEPVIPQTAMRVIAVMGVEAVGKRISETCCRVEQICELLGCTPDTVVTPEHAAIIMTDTRGMMKSVPPNAEFAVLLNKADTPERIVAADAVAKYISEINHEIPVYRAALGVEKDNICLY